MQLRLLVQIVEHHFRDFTALEFNDQAHTGLVRLILNVADTFNFFLVHQFGHALLQGFLVDLIRQLINDDGLTLTPVNVFKMAFGTHHHPTTAGAVAIFDSVDAINNAGGRKIRGRDDLHQFINGGLGVAQ
ncbi:hypothetical protein GALL_482720 [mine drainage metagenome]|uniref:Uncharacterized protein n=1 Tax=mine drainage metagenome TaxID=410659 RepID=A0A1J5PQW1_9ZZZZ